MRDEARQIVTVLVSSACFGVMNQGENNSTGALLRRRGYEKICKTRKVSGNLAGITNNVQQQLNLQRRRWEDVLIQTVSVYTLLPQSGRTLGVCGANAIIKYHLCRSQGHRDEALSLGNHVTTVGWFSCSGPE